MTYTKKQFLADVAAEAKALKKHATKEELEGLDIQRLNPMHVSRCIYGMIGHDCRSDRSQELIALCCKRFFMNAIYEEIDNKNGWDDESVKSLVNGVTSETPHTIDYISSIEVYIALPDAQNDNLIAFLRDERKDLLL